MSIIDRTARLHQKAAEFLRNTPASSRISASANLVAAVAEESSGPAFAADVEALGFLIGVEGLSKEWRKHLNGALPQPGPEPAISLSGLPSGSWLLIVSFQLVSDLICKDDQELHIIDNPIKKDRVHGHPEYWGPSWKGILRQAFRARFGEETAKGFVLRDKTPESVQDERLFGSAKGTKTDLRSGRLRFFTSRFHKIDFAVIHPSARKPKKGVPIFYETVPPGTCGAFRVLYCPWEAGAAEKGDFSMADAEAVGAAVKQMFALGLGAKSSAGFGEVRVTGVSCEVRGNLGDLPTRMKAWVQGA